MRTYGRDANGKWQLVETDANGYDDAVWLTTLVQALKLSPQESPYFSQYGIPGHASVVQQVLPTYYVNQMQTFFASKFSSLQIALTDAVNPYYTISIITNSGAKVVQQVYI